MSELDKKQIRRAFDRAAESYDRAAVLQQEIGRRMLDRLDLIRIQPERVLDLGAGTGWLSEQLLKKYTKARITAVDISPLMLKHAQGRGGWFRSLDVVCADAEALPFAAQTFDMVISNLCLQWVNGLQDCLQQMFRMLKPGGLLFFTTFGPDTLHELRQSWRRLDAEAHVHEFVDMHDIGDFLLQSGYSDPVVHAERITMTYSQLRFLLQDLKAIGANNAASSRRQTLTGKRRLQGLQDAYEDFRVDGVLPATYEVVYALAWGRDLRPGATVVPFQAG